MIGYFNSIRELGGAVRLLDDDIASRIRVVKNKYNSSEQRYLSFEGKKEITSRIPSWEIAQVLEKLAISYDKNKEKQGCYDVVIATNMIAVGMDVDRLGLMSVVGQPKQNSEYIQATSRVGRQHPGIIFTVYNPYRPKRTDFIKQYKLDARGWVLDVLNCVNQIEGRDFTLEQMYKFEDVLSKKHPDNNHIKDKIRQKLQILRDKGILEFRGRGHYRKI